MMWKQHEARGLMIRSHLYEIRALQAVVQTRALKYTRNNTLHTRQ